MSLSLLLVLAGCRTSAPPEPARQGEVPVDEIVAAPPTSLPDLDVPAHPLLTLGQAKPVPDSTVAYHPAQAAGTFRIYQLYTDVKGDPWRPETVQVEYIEPGGAEQHLRIAGDELVTYATREWGVIDGGWGVTRVMSTGQEEFQALSPPELVLALVGQYNSTFTGTQVTVEAIAQQQITVPSGTYQTARVERRWTIRGQQIIENSWWAPEGMVAQAYSVIHMDRRTNRLKVLVAQGSTFDAATLVPQVSAARQSLGLE